MGYGLFFASFELVKQQAYFSYLTWYYGGRKLFSFGPPTQLKDGPHHRQVIRPHYTLEPIFLLLAGACASVTQQSVLHPLSKIQQVYYTQLESIDYVEKIKHHEKSTTDAYRHGYEKTYQQCKKQASKVGGWRRWLWRGLAINTLRQVPSTSAGLFVFEIFRRRMGEQSEEVAIEYEDTIILLR